MKDPIGFRPPTVADIRHNRVIAFSAQQGRTRIGVWERGKVQQTHFGVGGRRDPSELLLQHGYMGRH